MTTHSITQRWLDGRHGPMRYWASEPRVGLPVLLIHGYGALIEHWRPVMRPIAARHTLLAMDLYGFGESAIPAEPPSRQLWADQAAELIAALGLGPAVVVGHSMGGMVAAQLALSYPHLVRGLGLVAATGLRDPDNSPSAVDELIFSLIRGPLVGDLLAGAVGNLWGARQGLLSAYHRRELVTEELVEAFARPLRRPGGARFYLSVTRAFPRLFLEAKAGAITAPALLIWGQHDRSVPPALGRYFQRTLLPEAELVVLPEAGHCPFAEDPDGFCGALLPWLDRIAGGA